MKSRLEARRKENVGRPKKGEAAQNAKKPQGARATFIVDADLLRKVKYISQANMMITFLITFGFQW